MPEAAWPFFQCSFHLLEDRDRFSPGCPRYPQRNIREGIDSRESAESSDSPAPGSVASTESSAITALGEAGENPLRRHCPRARTMTAVDLRMSDTRVAT